MVERAPFSSRSTKTSTKARVLSTSFSIVNGMSECSMPWIFLWNFHCYYLSPCFEPTLIGSFTWIRLIDWIVRLKIIIFVLFATMHYGRHQSKIRNFYRFFVLHSINCSHVNVLNVHKYFSSVYDNSKIKLIIKSLVSKLFRCW